MGGKRGFVEHVRPIIDSHANVDERGSANAVDRADTDSECRTESRSSFSTSATEPRCLEHLRASADARCRPKDDKRRMWLCISF